MKVNSNLIDDKAKKLIEDLAEKENVSQEKFDKWFESIDFSEVKNPSSYIIKSFRQALAKGTFTEKEQIVNVQPLLNEMREIGIKVLQDDTLYLYTLTQYLYNKGIMTADELNENFHKAIDYFKTVSGATSKDFIREFQNSKALKAKEINYEAVDKAYHEYLEKWNTVTKGLK